MLHVLFYEPADDVAAKAPAHFPAHQARLEEFHARDEKIAIEPSFWGSPKVPTMSRSPRAAAEDFVGGDPFVLNGVVRAWRVLDWDEIYSGS